MRTVTGPTDNVVIVGAGLGGGVAGAGARGGRGGRGVIGAAIRRALRPLEPRSRAQIERDIEDEFALLLQQLGAYYSAAGPERVEDCHGGAEDR